MSSPHGTISTFKTVVGCWRPKSCFRFMFWTGEENDLVKVKTKRSLLSLPFTLFKKSIFSQNRKNGKKIFSFVPHCRPRLYFPSSLTIDPFVVLANQSVLCSFAFIHFTHPDCIFLVRPRPSRLSTSHQGGLKCYPIWCSRGNTGTNFTHARPLLHPPLVPSLQLQDFSPQRFVTFHDKGIGCRLKKKLLLIITRLWSYHLWCKWSHFSCENPIIQTWTRFKLPY